MSNLLATFGLESRKYKVNAFALLIKRYHGASGHFSMISETLGKYLYLAWIGRQLPKSCSSKRKEAQYEREERELKRQMLDHPSLEFIECDFEEFEYYDPSTSNNHKHKRYHNQLRNLAIMCDRYQISDRAGSAISNAVLQDYGIITPDEMSVIIDKKKLHRSRFSVRRGEYQ